MNFLLEECLCAARDPIVIEQYMRDHNSKYDSTTAVDGENRCININNRHSNDINHINNNHINGDDNYISVGIDSTDIKNGNNDTDISSLEFSQAVNNIILHNQRKNGTSLSNLSNSDRDCDLITKGEIFIFIGPLFLVILVTANNTVSWTLLLEGIQPRRGEDFCTMYRSSMENNMQSGQ